MCPKMCAQTEANDILTFDLTVIFKQTSDSIYDNWNFNVIYK